MKVGIITLCRVRNYGACLQAYAMKEILQRKGHEVSFLNAYDTNFSKELMHNDFGNLRLWHIPHTILKELKYRRFFCNFPEASMQSLQDFDCVLLGSDSIWIYKYGKLTTPSSFFGNIDHHNISAYAPSVGGTYDLSNYSDDQIKGISRIRYITARDEMTASFVRDISGVEANIVVDPTLLLEWEDILRKNIVNTKYNYGKYVLLYGGLDADVIRSIKKYAKAHRLRIVNVGMFNWRIRNNPAVGPLEFVDLISHATLVLTSMFHGVMLSIALNKEFRYIAMDSQRGVKLSTILNQLNLKECMIDRADVIRDYNVFDRKVDRTNVKKLFSICKERSLKELGKCLDEKEDYNDF